MKLHVKFEYPYLNNQLLTISETSNLPSFIDFSDSAEEDGAVMITVCFQWVGLLHGLVDSVNKDSSLEVLALTANLQSNHKAIP